MFNQEAFGEKLKKHRKLKNLTQKEVAEKIGVSGQAISKWENGECLPDCYNLKMLGKVYQVSVDTLLETEEVATVDDLTGIFNKRHFMDISSILIDRARRHQTNCYILLFDIDNFKNINETYGHDMGDKVIIEFAGHIKSRIRPSDLFARYGGEEFIIFMTDTDDIGVCKAAERLRQSVCSANFEYDEASIEVTTSAGISKIVDFNMNKAIKNAGNALNAAKKEGRNRVSFYAGNNISNSEVKIYASV